MNEWFKRTFLGLLICSVALSGSLGCDDDKSPTGPEDEGNAEVSEEAVLLAGTLVQSLQEAFFASLIQDPTTVDGEQGTLDIAGNTWIFKGYSPDGLLFLDGQLIVEKDKFPNIPAKGELELAGSTEGTMIIDIMVIVQGVDITSTGTIQLGDQVWNMADLIAAGSAQEG